MLVRRVVTAHDDQGRSTVVADGLVDETPVPGIGGLFRVWSADVAAKYPDGGMNPNAEKLVPPPGGLRAFVFTLYPKNVAAWKATDRIQSVIPDMTMVMADTSGFHRTDSTDFHIVLEGEATLETGDGSKVVLRRGDTIVHQGTMHRWSNEGSIPAVLAGCMFGARREKS